MSLFAASSTAPLSTPFFRACLRHEAADVVPADFTGGRWRCTCGCGAGGYIAYLPALAKAAPVPAPSESPFPDGSIVTDGKTYFKFHGLDQGRAGRALVTSAARPVLHSVKLAGLVLDTSEAAA